MLRNREIHFRVIIGYFTGKRYCEQRERSERSERSEQREQSHLRVCRLGIASGGRPRNDIHLHFYHYPF